MLAPTSSSAVSSPPKYLHQQPPAQQQHSSTVGLSLSFSTHTSAAAAALLSQQHNHSLLTNNNNNNNSSSVVGAPGTSAATSAPGSTAVSSNGSGGGGGGGGKRAGEQQQQQPKREQVAEFFKLVKDGKINEVNHALKTNHQLALSHDEKQNSALYYAASLGDKQMSEILINAGCDVNHVGDSGYTALMAAAEKGFSQCCDLYIKSSHATVNARNYSGNSALHLAATRGHHDVCRVLIESGAEIGATNGKNLSAISEARAAQHYNLSDYLQQQMAHRQPQTHPHHHHSTSTGSHSSNSRFSPPLFSKPTRLSSQQHVNDVSKSSGTEYLTSFPLVSSKHSEVSSQHKSSSHSRSSNGHQSPFIGSEIGFPPAVTSGVGKLNRPMTPPESGDFGNPFLLDAGITSDSYITDSLVDKAPGGHVNGLDKSCSESTSSSVGENLNRLHSYKLNLGGGSTSNHSGGSSIRNSTGSLIDTKVQQMSHYPSCSSVLSSSHSLNRSVQEQNNNNLLCASSNSRPSSIYGGYPHSVGGKQVNQGVNRSSANNSNSLPHSSPVNVNSLDVNNLRAALRAVANSGGMHDSSVSTATGSGGLHLGSHAHAAMTSLGAGPVNPGSSILDIYTSLESAHRHQQQHNSASSVLTQNLLQALTGSPFGAGGGGGSGSSLSEQAAAAMQLQGLKQQQQQQMQMESLQYQLLINELSRKNRDLEFKLSEMESQFLTLQLENQRIRADNQKMSMRLRFSYP